MTVKKILFCFCLSAILVSCTGSDIPPAHSNDPVANNKIKYAKRFSIVDKEDYTLVYVFGNRTNFDTTAAWLIYPEGTSTAHLPSGITQIKIPCRKIAALSSIYASMLCELGVIGYLAAIDNIDYVNNEQIIEKHNKGALKELAKGPEIDLEQAITLHPDIIFTFGMGDPRKDVNDKLTRAGIPVAVSLDHLEESPLARAEWIKFYAAFSGKKETGDSIFSAVEKNYLHLKTIASGRSSGPTVFSEIKYGDVWYVPGGKSFMAQLLQDAGAEYVWRNDSSTGSLPLSFEQVYARAKDAQFWINLSVVKTKQELLNFEPRYAEFKAFKDGQLYNNNKVANRLGYSTYWETGMTHPDRILSDLVNMLQPQLKDSAANNSFYYQQIQ